MGARTDVYHAYTHPSFTILMNLSGKNSEGKINLTGLDGFLLIKGIFSLYWLHVRGSGSALLDGHEKFLTVHMAGNHARSIPIASEFHTELQQVCQAENHLLLCELKTKREIKMWKMEWDLIVQHGLNGFYMIQSTAGRKMSVNELPCISF